MKEKTFIYGFPVNWSQLQKIRTLVFNSFFIKISAIAETANDTEFSYSIFTEDKINKETKVALGHFIHGIICCIKSF